MRTAIKAFLFSTSPSSGIVRETQQVHTTYLLNKWMLKKPTWGQGWVLLLPINHGFPDDSLCRLTRGAAPGGEWQRASLRQQQRSLGNDLFALCGPTSLGRGPGRILIVQLCMVRTEDFSLGKAFSAKLKFETRDRGVFEVPLVS